MNLMRLPAFAVLAGLALLPGCSAIPGLSAPDYYQLDSYRPNAGQRATGQKQAIVLLVGPVSLADYLRQPGLIQRQGDETLKVEPKARWSSDLDAEVGQVLVSQLSNQLDSGGLTLYQETGRYDSDLQLLVSITRLDSGPGQPAVLQANWRLLDRAGKQHAGDLVRLEAPHNGQLSDQVRAQSLLVRQLADNLGQAVGRYQHSQAVAAANAAAAKARQKRQERRKPAPTDKEERPDNDSAPGPEQVRSTEVLRF